MRLEHEPKVAYSFFCCIKPKWIILKSRYLFVSIEVLFLVKNDSIVTYKNTTEILFFTQVPNSFIGLPDSLESLMTQQQPWFKQGAKWSYQSWTFFRIRTWHRSGPVQSCWRPPTSSCCGCSPWCRGRISWPCLLRPSRRRRIRPSGRRRCGWCRRRTCFRRASRASRCPARPTGAADPSWCLSKQRRWNQECADSCSVQVELKTCDGNKNLTKKF